MSLVFERHIYTLQKNYDIYIPKKKIITYICREKIKRHIYVILIVDICRLFFF